MKALLLSEYKKLNVVDMPTPEIGEDEVLVRVRACGICGSDIHGYDGSTGRRIPPLVMGHEAAGVIERAGTRGRRVQGRRSRDVRLDGVVRQVRFLPAGADQPVRQPHGARRVVRRLPPPRRLRRVRVGAGAHSLQASRQPAVRARGADRGRVDCGPRREPSRAEAGRRGARRRLGHDRRARDSGAAREGLPQHHRGRRRRRQAGAGEAGRRDAHGECERHRRAAQRSAS